MKPFKLKSKIYSLSNFQPRLARQKLNTDSERAQKTALKKAKKGIRILE